MPRIPRGLITGGVAHVLSRGNARATVFHSQADYEDCIRLLREALAQHEVDLFAFCLMPNHFHLVARFDDAAELSAMMQWWLTAQVRRYHKRHESTGHLWQGRFKSFQVQEDDHLLTLLRYVLVNPVRAHLVPNANDWPWSSLQFPTLVEPWPVTPPADLCSWLATDIGAEEKEALQESIRRNSPFGDQSWRAATARAGGLDATLRPRGRPKSGAPAVAGDAPGDTIH